MQKFRVAFTMIELIFVIVILGILATVAIPKLTATRDDAKTVVIAQNITIGVSEIVSYAVSKGVTDTNLAAMSNSIANLESGGNAVLNTSNGEAVIAMGSILDCVTVKVNVGTNDENLTISFGVSGGDTKCLKLQNIIDIEKYPMQLKGTSVVY